MFKTIKEFLFGKPTVVAEAPYKVEAPVEVAPVAVNDQITDSVTQATPAPKAVKPAVKAKSNKKVPAPKKQQFTKKPAAPKAKPATAKPAQKKAPAKKKI